MVKKTFSYLSLQFVKPGQATNFPSHADPRHPVASFKAARKKLVPHITLQMKTLFLHIEASLRNEPEEDLETLSKRHNREERMTDAEDVCIHKDIDDSLACTQVFQKQKNQLIDLQEH